MFFSIAEIRNAEAVIWLGKEMSAAGKWRSAKRQRDILNYQEADSSGLGHASLMSHVIDLVSVGPIY